MIRPMLVMTLIVLAVAGSENTKTEDEVKPATESSHSEEGSDNETTPEDTNAACGKCLCGERNEESRIVGGAEAGVSEFPWLVRLSYHRRHYCGGAVLNNRHVITAAHLCGERNEESRIVGGAEAGVSEFPWLVRLSYHRRHYCGGAVLNNRHVITAAHCVKGLMWFMIRVTLGEHDQCNRTRRPDTRFVLRVTAHDFSFSHFRNDIALLLLSEPIAISERVKPICLPHDDEPTYVGTKAIAAGWGSTSEKNNGSCVLREVELPVLSNEICKKTKYMPDMIADEMLCAGYPETGQKDSCQGDSGGPLTAERTIDKRYELLGVVSWGIGCARAGYPGVYTRVTKYLYWIRHNARPGCYCMD